MGHFSHTRKNISKGKYKDRTHVRNTRFSLAESCAWFLALRFIIITVTLLSFSHFSIGDAQGHWNCLWLICRKSCDRAQRTHDKSFVRGSDVALLRFGESDEGRGGGGVLEGWDASTAHQIDLIWTTLNTSCHTMSFKTALESKTRGEGGGKG